MKQLLVAILTICTLASCSLSKRIPDGKKLYSGFDVKINQPTNGLKPNELEEIKADVSENVLPKPNSAIFGFPIKVWFHFAVGEPKKKRGVRNFLQKRLGENPVYYSPSMLEYNKRTIENMLTNKGYFKSEVFGISEQEKYKEKAIFTLNVEPRYTIDSYSLSKSDFSRFNSKDTLNLLASSILKVNQPYDLELILKERSRVASLFQERGYYYMSDAQFEMQVDTNLGNQKLNLKLKLAPNINPAAIKSYKIRNINILTSEKNGQAPRDTIQNTLSNIQRDGEFAFGVDRNFRSKVFTEAILFRSGDEYSKTRQDASLNRLTNLKNFQFIRNRFDLVNPSDSNLLDVSYFLTPMKRKSVKFQLSGLTKSNGLYGSEAALSWQNKNLFRGAEILKLEVNGGVDLQFGQSEFGNNYRRLGLQGDLTFPRFLIPFKGPKLRLGSGVPKTNINLSYELLRRKDFYTQNSTNAAITYFWRRNVEYEHSLTPAYFSLIKSSNFSDEFINTVLASENLADLERYFQIIESRLLLGLEYKLNFTPQKLQTKFQRTAFTFGFDISGNVASLLAPASEEGSGGFKTLFNVPYEQFVKFEVDGRYFRNIGKLTFANRLFAGFGIPYKNSTMLPQPKQYFAGGSNGLRGFRGRSLGPGSVSPLDASESVFAANAFGDIKLEYNLELRYKASQYIELATFWDNGNIWTYRDDTFYGPKSKFTANFLKDIASDVGLGLRFDFTYLIIRGDLAIPARKPWLTESPWVLDQIQLGSKEWRQENLIFNLAIGHPF